MNKSTRKAVFSRDGYKCVCCGVDKDLTVDHIVPRSQGGANRLCNYQTMCSRCNVAKANQAIIYKDGVAVYIEHHLIPKLTIVGKIDIDELKRRK